MTTTSRFCRKCGAIVPPDSPEESCGACLLEMALGSDEPERDQGGSASPKTINAFGLPAEASGERVPPSPMSTDFGDYELLEEVGRGGQGVVFRARQKSLNRTVALKVIRLGQWASKAHLKRFRLEAEAAARLEHPGIVPIHEVGERDGSCYFSMKFVEGGQLDEVARREPMLIPRAVELITKVARTVHYAHEHGILHRDIKPGNILLDQNGEPHLTDFGLARLLETESSVTQTLDVLGTPSYMAPEQASGRNEQLTSATDVYGLGAVLYQLLTGHPPFVGGTTYETVRLVLESEPRQPRLWNPKIDRELSTICLKCLEKDPKRRYPSALALAEDLEHWLKHEPIQAKRSGFLTHGRKWVRRNPSTTVLVTLLLTLAAGLSMTIWNHTPAVVIPKSVAVLPFENLSHDPDNAYFADGIQEEILTRLASIAGLKVISRTSTQQYQSKPRNLAEIAKQLGVANILEGSVQKAADMVRVNVQLINAQTDSHLWADTYDRKVTDMFEAESEIAKRIAETLQAKLTGREKEALAVKPTNNPEAYEAYLRGLSLDERNYFSSYSTDLAEKAAGFYERAVQLDPNFAVAWARLSRVNAFISNFSSPPTSVARKEAAKHALDQAQKLAPNTPETLIALGGYQYMMLRDPAAAIATTERVIQMLPNSGEARMYLGMAARNEGHWDQSAAYLERALELDPRNLQNLTQAVTTYMGLRQFPAALKLCDRVLDIQPNDPDATANKVRIYQALGNLQEAAKLLSGINETSPGVVYETKNCQLQLERNYAELIRLQQARVTQHGSDLDRLNLAMYQRLVGDTAGAKVTAEKVRDIAEQSYREERRGDAYLAGPTARLSQIYAYMGEKDSALQLAERAIMLDSRGGTEVLDRGPSFEENLAWIQVMFGENSRAISTLTHLLQTPYLGWLYGPAPVTRALLRLDPMWDPLRSDPAFQKLCEEKQDLTTNGH